MLKIDRIDHIGIATSDLQASKEFFGGLLGLTAEPDISIAERSLQICFFKIGDSALEFVTPTAPDSPLTEHLDKRGAGLYHIALGVDNIKEVMAELQNKDVPLKDQVPRASKIGAHVAFLEQNAQTANISFELVERDKA